MHKKASFTLIIFLSVLFISCDSICWACMGSGTCSYCRGKLLVLTDGLMMPCPSCNQTGKCGVCGGSGLPQKINNPALNF